jgi:Uma2 family endonuclease
MSVLDVAANAVGLSAYEATNVRLGTDRIVFPDLVVMVDADPEAIVTDASEVVLVCEIVAPGNAADDRVSKMRLNAAAAIGYYLLVERDAANGLKLQLFRLDGTHYVEAATVHHGETLTSDDPFRFEIDTRTLLR